jgi:antitoxin (DNA-binding transcriptional repressor) of toxin-antitoxin stability system
MFGPGGTRELRPWSKVSKMSLAVSKKKEKFVSTTITVEEAQLTLKELIHRLAPGEEVVITENQQPIAKLVNEQKAQRKPLRPGPGLCKGMITYMAPDFDAPLEDMKEYME